MSRTVLVIDYAWPLLDIERQILAEVNADLVVTETGEEEEIVSLVPAADAILTNWKQVPAAALDAAPNCLVVSRTVSESTTSPSNTPRASPGGGVGADLPAFDVRSTGRCGPRTSCG